MTHIRLDHLITKRLTSGQQNSSGVALIAGDEQYTYADLDRRATELATRLHQLGVRQGDRILVLMHNRVEWFDVFFAAAKLRAVLVPGNYLFVAAELRYLVNDAEASFVISESALAEKLDFLVSDIQFEGRLLLVDDVRMGWSQLDVELHVKDGVMEFTEGAEPDEPFLLQYTSGTTGLPKAAVHTQATILFNVMAQLSDFELTSDDTYIILVALCWTAGFHAFTLSILLAGGRLVLKGDGAIEADDVCAAMAEHQVTVTALVPLLMRRFLASEQFTAEKLSTLRIVCTGTEPVPVELIREMRETLPSCDVVQAFGMTEILGSGIILRPEDAIDRIGSVGKGGTLTQVRIEDVDGREVTDGAVGELLIRSASTAKGYWNMPEESSRTFAHGWFRTGDLARVDDAGFIFVVGRMKDMIISGGLNIYPAEIERVLFKHPAVLEVAVIGTPDDKWGEVPAAVVVMNTAVSEDELKAFMSEQIAKYKVPKRWVLTSQPLPKTVSGKVRKFEIREIFSSSAPASVACWK